MDDNPYGEYGAARSQPDWRGRPRESIAERWTHFRSNHERQGADRDWDERRSFNGPEQESGPRRAMPGRSDDYGFDDGEAHGRGYGDDRRGAQAADLVGNANRRYFSQGYPEYDATETRPYRGDTPAQAYADSHRGKGPKGYRRSDERIREDVNDRLTEDHRLDASDIDVLVQDGEVTLNGFVFSREDKRRAEDLAERCSGVGHVQNNLRARPRETRAATANGTAGAGENLILDRVADGKSHLQPD